jgi:hypothetical protein
VQRQREQLVADLSTAAQRTRTSLKGTDELAALIASFDKVRLTPKDSTSARASLLIDGIGACGRLGFENAAESMDNAAKCVANAAKSMDNAAKVCSQCCEKCGGG